MEEMKFKNVEKLNSKEYWEYRFSNGDWEDKNGRNQTTSFAEAQVNFLRVPRHFEGRMLDFGCGLGDAIPVYRKKFPKAKLMGVDVSESAIIKCRLHYGDMAEFIQGTHLDVPESEIIIASNVFEHLENDIEVARSLLKKCQYLYIVVPYKEDPLFNEHIRAYDETYFQSLGEYNYYIYPSKGWSEYGVSYAKLMIKNVLRKMARSEVRPRKMQIMYVLEGLMERPKFFG